MQNKAVDTDALRVGSSEVEMGEWVCNVGSTFSSTDGAGSPITFCQMKSSVSVAAFFVPLVVIVFGLAYAIGSPSHPNDWTGAGVIIKVGVALLVASLAAAILSFWAFRRGEKLASRTLLFSIPGSIFLIWTGVYFLESYGTSRKLQNEERVYNKLYADLQNDSSLLRSKNWSTASNPEKRALKYSLELGAKNFTEEDVVFVFETYEQHRLSAFMHPKFPEHLLVKHFDEAWDLCESDKGYSMLAAICSNPNTPVNLLTRVAESKTLMGGAVSPAQQTLKKIKRQNKAE